MPTALSKKILLDVCLYMHICEYQDGYYLDIIDKMKAVKDQKKTTLHMVFLQVDWRRTEKVTMCTAIMENDVETVKRMLHCKKFAIYEANGLSVHVADIAALYGRLEILQFLASCEITYSNDPEASFLSFTQLTMSMAAISGNLSVVEYLHNTRNEGCTTDALDNAAKWGHLAIVQFLVAKRNEGGSVKAINLAAAHGHFDVVKFLHNATNLSCSVRAVDNAAANGYFDIVKFLLENRTEGCSSRAMELAAINGHLDILIFLYQNRVERCDTRTLALVAAKGHLDIVQFLCENHLYSNTLDAIENAASHG